MQHMGVPTASVCMGFMSKSRMPVNLTFAAKHGQDVELLKYSYAFEKQTKHRIEPPVTPALESDQLSLSKSDDIDLPPTTPLEINIFSAERVSKHTVRVNGATRPEHSENVQLEAFIDGQVVPNDCIASSQNHWTIEAEFTPYDPRKPLYGGVGMMVGNVNVVILARSGRYVAGKLVMIPQEAGSTA